MNVSRFNLPGYFMKAFFEDNFQLSFSSTLVQPQYPKSKEHSSSIAAEKQRNESSTSCKRREVQAINNSGPGL